MAGLVETREFLDVQVQQLTGVVPLVAADARGRFEGIEPVKPCPAQDSDDGGGRHSHGPRDLDPRLPLEAHRRNAGDDVRGRGPGLPVVEHTGDQFGSTRGCGSGILMDVHSVLRDETTGFLTTSFSRRDRVDNVLRGHS